MLPFLKKKNESSVAGLIMKTRTPDEKPEVEESDDLAAIESAASELVRAIHARDTKAVAAALKDALDIIQSMPEESNESDVNPHSYEAQNIKAAQES